VAADVAAARAVDVLAEDEVEQGVDAVALVARAAAEAAGGVEDLEAPRGNCVQLALWEEGVRE
jgi:hypothetical protein